MLILIAAVLSLVIGVVLGMLGGGGAILTLPMLVYAVHVEAKVAIATSLFVVGATSLVSALVHARAGTVQWKVGGVFGAAAMAGAFAGGRLAQFVPGTALLILFGVVMLIAATAMLRGRADDVPAPRALAIGRTVALGGGVGLLSGLVGAGGGFLIVPALSILGGLAIREAIGTSLFVITLQSFAGFAGHVTHVELDWQLVGAITAACVAGSIAGSLLGKRATPTTLRRAFAWLVIAMGLFLMAKEAPPFVAILAGVCTLVAVLLLGRRPAEGSAA